MPYSPDVIQRIAKAHGMSGPVELMPASGMVNEAWMLDNRFVLRITLLEDAFDEAPREAWVVPLVRQAGILSPELIVIDESKTIVDSPYTIYRKAEGILLGELSDDPANYADAYRDLGRQFAIIHAITVPEKGREQLRKASSFDAKKQLKKSLEVDKVTHAEAALIEACILELGTHIGERTQRTLVHQDIHPWNMFVDPETRRLTSIIDWGDTAWGDPAAEFASMPLAAVPYMLEGYADAGCVVDKSFVARSLHLGLALCLWEVRDLDPSRFMRQWWRHSPKGFGEDVKLIREILG
jgi:aminoglycoside phosphotransferase (APT) family kinase protein